MVVWAQRLRGLRAERGLSLAQLGALVHYHRSYLSELERGRKPPTVAVAAALDEALGAGGVLLELPGVVPDRVVAGVSGVVRPDAAMVGYLTRALVLHREAEDGAGAGLVLPVVVAQVGMVSRLREAAGGELRDRLLSVEAQHAQFVGWLHQDLGDSGESERWYGRALLLGHEVGDDSLVASVLSMRSNAAWSAGDAGSAVALGEAACRPAGASPGVLALNRQQLGRAYAMRGWRVEMLAALGEAERLSEVAGRRPDAEPPWIYFQDPARLQVQRALALRDAGDYRAAIALLEEAVAALPPEFRRDRGVYLARLAVAHVLAGDREAAVEVAGRARAAAGELGSARLGAELARVDAAAGGS